MEKTLGIIKPDGVARNLVGNVLARIEKAGLTIAGLKMEKLGKTKAEGFYAVHRERPFFGSLVEFMTSGPVVVICIEGPNAVAKWRELMGATNPANAAPGTIRKDLALDIEKNTVHGSDSAENANIEVAYFFAQSDLCPRS